MARRGIAEGGMERSFKQEVAAVRSTDGETFPGEGIPAAGIGEWATRAACMDRRIRAR